MDLLYFAIWYALGFISFAIITFKPSTFTKGDLVTAFLVSFMGLFVAVVFIMEKFEPDWWGDKLFKTEPTNEPIQPVKDDKKVVKMNPNKSQRKAKRKPKQTQKKNN